MFEDQPLALRQVEQQQELLRRLVERLEPVAVPLPEAAPMWQAFDAIERLAVGAKTLLAARVDESGVAGRAGDKGTAEYLARRSGTSPAAARTTLETSRRLARLPQTSRAVRRGELSRQQAEEIADTADKNPDAEQRLLETAMRTSLGELRQECARRRAEADPDPEATRARLHRGRFLRRWTDAEGAWNLAARGTPDDGSRFNAVLDRIRDEIFGQARRGERREAPEAYAFDALIELARRHGTRRRASARSHDAGVPDTIATFGTAGDAAAGSGSCTSGHAADDYAGRGHAAGNGSYTSGNAADGHGADGDAAGDNAAENRSYTSGSAAGDHAAGIGSSASGSAAGGNAADGDARGGHAADNGSCTSGHTASGNTADRGAVGGNEAPEAEPAARPPASAWPLGASGSRGGPVDPTHLALLRIDWEALVRGRVDHGEVCEIAGVGPVSVAAARALLGESVLRLVVTKGSDVVNVTNLGRGPRAAQKIALLWSSPECAVRGCVRRWGIEHDHRDPWAAVHETAIDNLDRLCSHHHELKTRHGWALVAGAGKRPIVPPGDPRHPANQRRHPSNDRPPPEPGPDPEPERAPGPPPGAAGPVPQAQRASLFDDAA